MARKKSAKWTSRENTELFVYLLFFLVGAVAGMLLMSYSVGIGLGFSLADLLSRTSLFILLGLIGLVGIAYLKGEVM